MAETVYIVLRRSVADSETWHLEAGAVPASSADAAIRLTVKGVVSPPPDAVYVAIPARSFKPVTVTAVQTTILKLEETKP